MISDKTKLIIALFAFAVAMFLAVIDIDKELKQCQATLEQKDD